MSIDAKNLGKVAVLMGGPSAEREISLLSGNGVLAALREKSVDAHAFDPVMNSLFDLPREKFERVFIALPCMGDSARTARCKACWRH